MPSFIRTWFIYGSQRFTTLIGSKGLQVHKRYVLHSLKSTINSCLEPAGTNSAPTRSHSNCSLGPRADINYILGALEEMNCQARGFTGACRDLGFQITGNWYMEELWGKSLSGSSYIGVPFFVETLIWEFNKIRGPNIDPQSVGLLLPQKRAPNLTNKATAIWVWDATVWGCYGSYPAWQLKDSGKRSSAEPCLSCQHVTTAQGPTKMAMMVE